MLILYLILIINSYISPIDLFASQDRCATITLRPVEAFEKALAEPVSFSGSVEFRTSIENAMIDIKKGNDVFDFNINGKTSKFLCHKTFDSRHETVFARSVENPKLSYIIKKGTKGSGIEKEAIGLRKLQREIKELEDRLIDYWSDSSTGSEFVVLKAQAGLDLEQIGIDHRAGQKIVKISEIEKMLMSAYLKLRRMHRAGYLFSDLKPANIIGSIDLSKVNYVDFEGVFSIKNPQDCHFTSPLYLPIRIRLEGNHIPDQRSELWSLAFSFLHTFGYAQAEYIPATYLVRFQTIDMAKIEADFSNNPRLLYLVKALLAQEDPKYLKKKK